jgi:ActR/RegA family two-component response regulator
LLHQYAPSWLVHLPALLAAEQRERLERTARVVTPTRMLRELAEALEVLTADRPLVLVLEDLHWSDRATLEWLAYVGRRRDPARLLILGTYRPVEVIVQAHPLRALLAEFQPHPQYAELVLDYLSGPQLSPICTTVSAEVNPASATMFAPAYQRQSSVPGGDGG